jgi:AcrR family transcriptional regulator
MPRAKNATAKRKQTEQAKPDIATAVTRSRLIDAAEHCYALFGIKATNMEDIAVHAEITRRTVYRYFANRDEILDAVVNREVERFWVSFNATQKKFDDLGVYLVEALVFTLKHAPTTRSHSFLFNEEVLPLVNKMYIDNRQHILERVAALQVIYNNHLKRGGIRAQLDLVMLCEWFNRLAVSYLAAPSPFYRTESELRELFRAMLLPIIKEEYISPPTRRVRKTKPSN